jgi:hypothetical protein
MQVDYTPWRALKVSTFQGSAKVLVQSLESLCLIWGFQVFQGSQRSARFVAAATPLESRVRRVIIAGPSLVLSAGVAALFEPALADAGARGYLRADWGRQLCAMGRAPACCGQ